MIGGTPHPHLPKHAKMHKVILSRCGRVHPQPPQTHKHVGMIIINVLARWLYFLGALVCVPRRKTNQSPNQGQPSNMLSACLHVLSTWCEATTKQACAFLCIKVTSWVGTTIVTCMGVWRAMHPTKATFPKPQRSPNIFFGALRVSGKTKEGYQSNPFFT